MVAQKPFFGVATIFATIFAAASLSTVLGECEDPTGERLQLVEKFDGSFNGNQYMLVTNPRLTWDQAAQTCVSYCGVLTSIQSNDEMQYLVSMIRNFEAGKPQDSYKTGHALVGGYRVGTEGREYRWIETGEVVDPFIWAGGNPYASSDGETHYTILWDRVNGTEDHHRGSQTDNFICKILSGPQPNGNETEFSCTGRECGSYPDERNCSNYYVCGVNGTVEHKTCAHGLHFDQVTRSCDLATFAVCAEQFTCEGKACGRYPDPTNCTAFYVCEGNSTRMDLERRSCPHGLEFDVASQTCDLPEYASCSGSNATARSTSGWTNYPETSTWSQPETSTWSQPETSTWSQPETSTWSYPETTNWPVESNPGNTGSWQNWPTTNYWTSTPGYPYSGEPATSNWQNWPTTNYWTSTPGYPYTGEPATSNWQNWPTTNNWASTQGYSTPA